MRDKNPYSAPAASLESDPEANYEPKVFSFRGRIGRLRYLSYGIGISILFMLGVGLLGNLAERYRIATREEGLAFLVGLAIILVSIVVTITYGKRRFNDLNRSGWWSILLLIPYIQLLPVIYLLFFPGTNGPNRYGPAPSENSVGVLIAGWMMPLLAIVGIAAAIVIPLMRT